MPGLRPVHRATAWNNPQWVCRGCRHELLRITRQQPQSRWQSTSTPNQQIDDDWASNFNDLSADIPPPKHEHGPGDGRDGEIKVPKKRSSSREQGLAKDNDFASLKSTLSDRLHTGVDTDEASQSSEPATPAVTSKAPTFNRTSLKGRNAQNAQAKAEQGLVAAEQSPKASETPTTEDAQIEEIVKELQHEVMRQLPDMIKKVARKTANKNAQGHTHRTLESLVGKLARSGSRKALLSGSQPSDPPPIEPQSVSMPTFVVPKQRVAADIPVVRSIPTKPERSMVRMVAEAQQRPKWGGTVATSNIPLVPQEEKSTPMDPLWSEKNAWMRSGSAGWSGLEHDSSNLDTNQQPLSKVPKDVKREAEIPTQKPSTSTDRSNDGKTEDSDTQASLGKTIAGKAFAGLKWIQNLGSQSEPAKEGDSSATSLQSSPSNAESAGATDEQQADAATEALSKLYSSQPEKLPSGASAAEKAKEEVKKPRGKQKRDETEAQKLLNRERRALKTARTHRERAGNERKAMGKAKTKGSRSVAIGHAAGAASKEGTTNSRTTGSLAEATATQQQEDQSTIAVSDTPGSESLGTEAAPETANIAFIQAENLSITPLNIPQPPVPALEYGLDRVLFNPGVYQLQDPLSRVYNFDPYLQKIMPVVEFDYNALKEYKTSSQDNVLINLAKEHGKRYIGSTSSMTATLGHFHYLLSEFRPINLNMLSRGFPDKADNFTNINRAPNAIFLRWKNGTYAIDADKEYDGANVLMMLGKSMEKLLTLPTSDFERYRKSDPRAVSHEERTDPEAYEYTTMGDFLMRSQLDAYDPRLPGTGVFDLKTRAVVSIRMNTEDFQPMTGYEIQTLHGRFQSYEREYYDMLRSTMLKYMLQVRMGRMDGIFVAYHNVERIFGFQYISLQEMDRALHGQVDLCLGDQEFKISLELLNKIFDKATAKFPDQSLRFHFETAPENLGSGSSATVMWIYAEPMAESDVERIQSTSKDKVAEFERTMMGVEQESEAAAAASAAAEVKVAEQFDVAKLDKESEATDAVTAAPKGDAEAKVADDFDVAKSDKESEATDAINAAAESDTEAKASEESDVVSSNTGIPGISPSTNISRPPSSAIETESPAISEAKVAEESKAVTPNTEISESLPSTDASSPPSSADEIEPPAEALADYNTTNSHADPKFVGSIETKGTEDLAPLFIASLICQSKVNGVPRARPESLKPTDKWQVEYVLEEWDTTERMWARYVATKAKRREMFQKYKEEDDDDETTGTGKAKQEKGYTAFLKSLSEQGRTFRGKMDELEDGKAPVVVGQPVDIAEKKSIDVREYVDWLYKKSET